MATKLINAAISARNGAYAPYSGFKVGAALLGRGGEVYTGCNIENASYGATVCAERVALYKAISGGTTAFTAIAVAGGGDTVTPTPPCGICRQTLAEFCGADFAVYIVNSVDGSYTKTTLGELFPNGFGTNNLNGKE